MLDHFNTASLAKLSKAELHGSDRSSRFGKLVKECDPMGRDGFEISADREPVPADYLDDLNCEDGLTEEQRLELLNILFDIMKSFVLMGYGMEPVNKLLESFEISARGNDPVLEFEHDENGEGDA